ncbi:MAG: hypothetical protein DPW22_01120 [Alphaproteobacteria bacterium]|nr:hypothetical protein [Alphaproteobacteria bacterium]
MHSNEAQRCLDSQERVMPGGDQEGRRAATAAGAARERRSAFLFLALALVAAIWFVAMSRWILTDTVVPWDSKNQFYAFFRFLTSSLQAGLSPFWNPYHYGGHPSVADPQSLIFSPAFVLWGLFDADPSIRTFDLLVHAHVLAGALALVVIGWRAQWPVAACVLAAAVFMLGGAASGRLQHTGAILSYGLFPVALLLLQVALAHRSLAAGLGFALVAASLALGRNQVALLLCYALVAFAAAEIAAAPRPAQYLRARGPLLAVMAFAGLALVVLPMLLTVQFAALSNRPDILLADALKGSLHPANLATLAFADVFGSHRVDYWGPGWRMPEIQFTDQSFNYLYVGVVPVFLLLVFGLAGGGLVRPGRRLIAGLLAVSLLYMLGRYTPVFALMFELVPGVHLFRRPADASFVFLAALAFACGALLTDYVRHGLPPVTRARVLAVSGATLLVLAGAFVIAMRAGELRATAVVMLQTAHVIVLVAAIVILTRGARGRAYAASALVAVAVGELLFWNATSMLNAERRALYAVLERPQPDDARALARLDVELTARRRDGDFPRVEIMGVGGPWQNLAMVRRYESINGYNPLRIGLYDRLVAPGEATFAPVLRNFPGSFDSYDCALARALGLEYVVLDRQIENVPRLAKRPVAETLVDGPRLWIYRLKNTMPRVALSDRIQVADADATNAAGQLLFPPSADRVLVDEDTPPRRAYAAAGEMREPARARIVAWAPDRVEIETRSQAGGVLVLHATYYPGWRAEIDGRPAPVLRANVLFRGVEVPAGLHRVVFRFAPFALDNLRDALRVALHGAR